MSYSNRDLARAFVDVKGAGSGSSHTQNFWWEDGRIYSYRMLIGAFQNGQLFVRAQEDSPSVTTSQHLSCLFSAAYRINNLCVFSFDKLEALGYSLCDVKAGYGDRFFTSLVVKDNGWIHFVSEFGCDVRITEILEPCVWRTANHVDTEVLHRALVPPSVYDAAWDVDVWRIGDMFIVGLPDVDYKRKHVGGPTWHVGWEQTPLTVLDRAQDDVAAYCGMVRIEGASFSPKTSGYEWFRVVPANVRSLTRRNTSRTQFVPL